MLSLCVLSPLSFISDREIWKSLRAVAGITLFTRHLVGQKGIQRKPDSFDSSVSVYRISVDSHIHKAFLGTFSYW